MLREGISTTVDAAPREVAAVCSAAAVARVWVAVVRSLVLVLVLLMLLAVALVGVGVGIVCGEELVNPGKVGGSWELVETAN